MSDSHHDPDFKMTFVHFCPTCNRRLMLEIESFGKRAKCGNCGRSSVALDRDIESAALLDEMKIHAELAVPAPTENYRTQRPR